MRMQQRVHLISKNARRKAKALLNILAHMELRRTGEVADAHASGRETRAYDRWQEFEMEATYGRPMMSSNQ